MFVHNDLEALKVPAKDLKPREGNPRRGNIDQIVESLETNGQYRPIVVNKRTNEILAGNHTWQAANRLGWEEIAVTYVDVDEEAAAKIVLIDNRANDLADYDYDALAKLLGELPSLEGTGYDAPDWLDDSDDTAAEDASAGGADDRVSDITTRGISMDAEQHATIKEGLREAKLLGHLDLGLNPNRNGSALARICEIALMKAGPQEEGGPDE